MAPCAAAGTGCASTSPTSVVPRRTATDCSSTSATGHRTRNSSSGSSDRGTADCGPARVVVLLGCAGDRHNPSAQTVKRKRNKRGPVRDIDIPEDPSLKSAQIEAERMPGKTGEIQFRMRVLSVKILAVL